MKMIQQFGIVSVLAMALATGTVTPGLTKSPVAAAATPIPAGAIEAFATLRDGTRLAANVYQPAGKGPWPVIMTRTPYLKDGRPDPKRDPDGSKTRAALAAVAKH